MTWGTGTQRGGVNTKVAGASLTGAPSANIVVERILFVAAFTDNTPTTDGVSAEHSISDTLGHTWTKGGEFTNGRGSAGAGVTTSLWATRVTTEITTGDSITLTCASSVTAKALAFWESTVAAGKTFQFGTAVTGQSNASATGPSLVTSGLANAEHLFLAAEGWEGPGGDVYTKDTDYAFANSRGTTGGTDTANIAGQLHRRIFTGTGDTYQASLSVARDWASVFVPVDEVDLPASGDAGYPYVGGGYYG